MYIWYTSNVHYSFIAAESAACGIIPELFNYLVWVWEHVKYKWFFSIYGIGREEL